MLKILGTYEQPVVHDVPNHARVVGFVATREPLPRFSFNEVYGYSMRLDCGPLATMPIDVHQQIDGEADHEYLFFRIEAVGPTMIEYFRPGVDSIQHQEHLERLRAGEFNRWRINPGNERFRIEGSVDIGGRSIRKEADQWHLQFSGYDVVRSQVFTYILNDEMLRTSMQVDEAYMREARKDGRIAASKNAGDPTFLPGLTHISEQEMQQFREEGLPKNSLDEIMLAAG